MAIPVEETIIQSIKDLYNWAVENKCENYIVLIGHYSTNCIQEDIEINRKEQWVNLQIVINFTIFLILDVIRLTYVYTFTN